MRSRLAVIALFGAAAGLASCDGEKADKAAGAAPDAAHAEAVAPGTVQAPSLAPSQAPASAGGGAAVAGAPAFAVVFPGGEVDTAAEPDLTGAEAGLAFTTEASPDEVVEFYRNKAEQAGLASVMSMNQGDVRAYGAADAPGAASLRVLAHPSDDGRTSVQLSWKGGQ